MSFLSWPPGALKELLRHAPALFTEVIEWRSMAHEAGQLSKRWMSGEGSGEARQGLSLVLPAPVRFTQTVSLPPLTDEQKHELGELILQIYFTQVLNAGPLFLDLRPTHFGRAHDEWQWAPGPLWGQYSAAFARGLRDVYQGFYGGGPAEQLRRGLRELGLIQESWSEAERRELEELFRASFGGSNTAPMRFSLSTFQQSFQGIFKFLLERKVKLGGDFVLLGINLLTLYMALEELGQEWAVAQSYEAARARVENNG